MFGMSEVSAPTPRLRRDLWLLLILVLAASFRLQYVTAPLADAHSWRQVTNADIARNFAEQSLNIFYPRVNWGGPSDAYVGMEFPLLQWLGGVAFLFADKPELALRLITIVFSLITVVAVYGLGVRLFGVPAGRAAAFLMAISPSAIFFGRAFISDTPMLCFSVLAVWAFAVYADTGSTRALTWGTIAAALACLVKIPAVILFAPVAMLGFQARRWRVLRDVRLVAGIAAALMVTAAWYWHADVLYHRTGLGQAIWHPSGTYGPEIAAASASGQTISHWSTLEQLGDGEFYREMVHRAWSLHLTPPGFALALFAVMALRARRRPVVLAWLAAAITFILASAEGQKHHEFHQLPLLPPAVLLFGLAAAPAFDGAWLRARGGAAAIVLTPAALVAVGVLAFQTSGVVPLLFRPTHLNYRVIAAGKAINGSMPKEALLTTVDYPAIGANSPILLYHAHRRGWSFDGDSVTPHVLRQLRVHHGARYFATLIWSELGRKQPDLARYLETQKRIPLGLDDDVALFELE